jgi:methionyl-tRNA synthetase
VRRSLGIGIDRFERTTSEIHKAFAIQFWERLEDSGDIYLGSYEGRYCIDCEQYFTDEDICPVHRKPLDEFSEPSYFFRLSAYQERLIDHIEANTGFIRPESRRNEVLSFLKGNKLRDLSVSRTSTEWGIPVPGDAGHVFYVWVDALTTYLSALSPNEVVSLDDEVLQCWWRNTTHFIGKDILTFHGIYWPALLWSAGLPLPRRLVVNGWLTVEGRKIAKSDPATIVDPCELTELVGRDGLRFYFLKGVTLGQDINFQSENLIQLVNADLVNGFGNLISRYTRLAAKRLGTTYCCNRVLKLEDNALLDRLEEVWREFPELFEDASVSHAARRFSEIIGEINAYFQQQAPWQITDSERLATVLWTVHHAIADATVLGTPFAPEACAAARRALCLGPAHWDCLGQRSEKVNIQETGSIYPRIVA